MVDHVMSCVTSGKTYAVESVQRSSTARTTRVVQTFNGVRGTSRTLRSLCAFMILEGSTWCGNGGWHGETITRGGNLRFNGGPYQAERQLRQLCRPASLSSIFRSKYQRYEGI